MKLPSNRQLQYFSALVEHGHFGRAADACFVSQSAFSNAIKELESVLGTQLVDRTNRSVTITATGQLVATQARLVLQDVKSLVELAAGERQPLTGELRMGIIPTIAPFLLPKILPKLRRQYPTLELYLIEDQTERIYQRLMRGELDVLFDLVAMRLVQSIIMASHSAKEFPQNAYVLISQKPARALLKKLEAGKFEV